MVFVLIGIGGDGNRIHVRVRQHGVHALIGLYVGAVSRLELSSVQFSRRINCRDGSLLGYIDSVYVRCCRPAVTNDPGFV